MPPLPPVAGILKADFQWTYGSDTNVHSHIFMHTGASPVSQSDLAGLAGAINSLWVANLLQYQPSSATLKQIECSDLGNPSTLPGIYPGNVVGTLSGQVQTAETCLLVNLTIGRRYRGGHPRLYWPLGGPVYLADPQHWSSSWISTVQGKVNTFFGGIVGSTIGSGSIDHIANVSYHTGGSLRPTPVWDPVLAYPVNPIPGSQRRRMGR